MPKIGDPLRTGVANPIDGKPEKEWYKQVKAQLDEFGARLSQLVSQLASSASGGAISLTGAITAATAVISGTLTAAAAVITGLLTAGSATISGALGAASAAITGLLTAGSMSVTGVSTLGTTNAAALTCTTLHATAAATLDTTLGVTGTSTLAGVNAGAVSGSSLTTAEGDVHTGAASMPFSAHALTFNYASGFAAADVPTRNRNSILGQVTLGAVTCWATLLLPVGKRITSIKLYVRAQNTSTVSLSAWRTTQNVTAPVQLGTTQTSGTGGGSVDATLTISGLTETVATDRGYEIEVILTSVSGTQCSVYGGEIFFDRP